MPGRCRLTPASDIIHAVAAKLFSLRQVELGEPPEEGDNGAVSGALGDDML